MLSGAPHCQPPSHPTPPIAETGKGLEMLMCENRPTDHICSDQSLGRCAALACNDLNSDGACRREKLRNLPESMPRTHGIFRGAPALATRDISRHIHTKPDRGAGNFPEENPAFLGNTFRGKSRPPSRDPPPRTAHPDRVPAGAPPALATRDISRHIHTKPDRGAGNFSRAKSGISREYFPRGIQTPGAPAPGRGMPEVAAESAPAPSLESANRPPKKFTGHAGTGTAARCCAPPHVLRFVMWVLQ